MSCWQTSFIKVLRVLINDNGNTQDYTDTRLEDIIIVAASQVAAESGISTYTVSIAPPDITPTPVDDAVFRNLVTLKSACIVDRGNMRLAAAVDGLEAKCGPATMRVSRRVEGFATLIDKGYCAAYDEALRQYLFGNLSFARGILSPFVNENFDPRDYSGYHTDHTRKIY